MITNSTNDPECDRRDQRDRERDPERPQLERDERDAEARRDRAQVRLREVDDLVRLVDEREAESHQRGQRADDEAPHQLAGRHVPAPCPLRDPVPERGDRDRDRDEAERAVVGDVAHRGAEIAAARWNASGCSGALRSVATLIGRCSPSRGSATLSPEPASCSHRICALVLPVLRPTHARDSMAPSAVTSNGGVRPGGLLAGMDVDRLELRRCS